MKMWGLRGAYPHGVLLVLGVDQRVEVEARLEQAQALIGQLTHRLHGPNTENVQFTM